MTKTSHNRITANRRVSRRSLAIAAALLLASCTSASTESASNQLAAETTAPTTTTTTSTTTTTTTTLPPGLQPQVLTYGAGDDQLWIQDLSTTTETSYEFVEYSVGDMNLEDLGSDESGELTLEFSGQQRVLFLEIEPDVYEAVLDLTFDEGSLTIASGQEQFSQSLTAEDLAASPVVMAPVVMTASGEPATAMPGTPNLYQADPGLELVLGNFGPAFTADAVDEGDTWPIDDDTPLFGPITGEAEIVDELETDDGYAFVIDFSARYPDLPAQTTLEEMTQAAPYAAGAMDMIMSDIPEEVTATVDITESTVAGTVTLLPESGTPAELTTDSHRAFTVTIGDETGRIVIDYVIDSTATYELTDNSQATSFEESSVLDQYEANPNMLADAALQPLMYYDIDWPSDEVWSSVGMTLGTTAEEAVAGYSAVTVIGDDGDTVDVFSLTSDGFFRGYPDLAGDLVSYWTDGQGREVAVNGETAYRATIDDREWLVWSNVTSTFIVIGPRAFAEEVLGQLVGGPDPYLWQAGDCLTYDAVESLPYAPYGELGLTHCRRKHGFEVIYSEVLTDGPDAPYPDDLGDHLLEACGGSFKDYTGVYPLESSLDMISYIPDDGEWARGSRYIACLAYLADSDGPVTTKTRLEGAGPDNLVEIEPGTCLSNYLPVPCSEPHDAEVTSAGVYEAAGDEFPGLVTIGDDLDEICATALDAYEPSEGELEIDSDFASDMPYGWDDGIRSYYCVGHAVDEDGFTADITGELKGVWEIAPAEVDA